MQKIDVFFPTPPLQVLLKLQINLTFFFKASLSTSPAQLVYVSVCLQLQPGEQHVGRGARQQRPSLQIRPLSGSAPGNTAAAASHRSCLRR